MTELRLESRSDSETMFLKAPLELVSDAWRCLGRRTEDLRGLSYGIGRRTDLSSF